jgi:alpha-ribazole phosphatase/probable phosphoglycerate mutase
MPLSFPAQPVRLLLIRHGEVEERYQKIFGGCRIDMNLSVHGQQQAQGVDAWIADLPVDRLYASPMRRAQQTLAPLAARRGLVPITLTDLREVDFGDWTGCHWEELRERFGVSAFAWLDILERGEVPHGESAAALLARVKPCLQRILDESAGGSAAVVCHGGIVRALLALLLDLPLGKTAHFRVEYGSIAAVLVQPDKPHRVEIDMLNVRPLHDPAALRDL